MSKANLTGVIQITGEHDVGKTTFALECGVEPKKIAFFDDDVKGRGTVNSLREAGFEFGAYHDLTKLAEKKTELAFHDEVLKIIKAIRPGQFDAIVWDTWTGFANTCHPYVLRHPSDFRASWSPMGKIKGAQQWQEARKYEAMLLNMLATVSPLVFVITHLKDHYINDAKVPGKQIPASSGVLDRVPTMRIWLRQNPSGRPVPIGLILKRIDKKVYVPGTGIRTVNVLPRKIVPNDSEQSLWDTIQRYWDNPIGNREPLESEVPTEYELSILDSTLTAEQTRTFKLMLESGMAGKEEEENGGAIVIPPKKELDVDTVMAIKAMQGDGKKPPEIAAELDVPIADVLKAIRLEIKEDTNPDVEFAMGGKNG